MAKNFIGLYKENNFYEKLISISLTENEEHTIPSQILKTHFWLYTSFIF